MSLFRADTWAESSRTASMVSAKGNAIRTKSAVAPFYDGMKSKHLITAAKRTSPTWPLSIEAFTRRNEILITTMHELGHYWVGEYFNLLGLWVAVDTSQCRKNYPAIWDWLDENDLSGCCRCVGRPRQDDFAHYCYAMAGIESERVFLEAQGFSGTTYGHWPKHHHDPDRKISDQSMVAANPLSHNPSARLAATSLIRRVLVQNRSSLR